jgi:hypothetical protein
MPSGGLETTIKIPFENIEVTDTNEPIQNSRVVS